ncbi:MAG: exonuclease, partial [Euryarchaeota archaeon]|nr:exonuclease [Euryarchaeota archaeon]
MIDKSFIFLPGVGQLRERRIWQDGIYTWGDFMEAERVRGISPRRKPLCDAELEKAAYYRRIGSPVYFARTVPRKEQWRLFETWPDRVFYLDIETTGLSPHRSQVTVVGIHDGHETTTLVRGRDLTEENLLAELDGCKMLVTF